MKLIAVLLAVLTTLPLVALTPESSLRLTGADVRIEAYADGYHLIIKKTPAVESVLLTEAFEPAGHKLATYSFRGLEPNALNGQEKRLLNGKFLPGPHTDLISSTVVPDKVFGEAFVILIPPVVEYGYHEPGARFGRINLAKRIQSGQSLWFSVRTFSRPYADYTGRYEDNAFELSQLVEKATPAPADTDSAVDRLRRLGPVYVASDITKGIHRIQSAVHDDLDMVICIDTTNSMRDYLKALQKDLLGPIAAEAKNYQHFRLGLVFYRDYMEDYLTRVVTFQSDVGVIQKALDQATAAGGGDIPEAVVEGLWAALNSFDWQADHRLILVIGDAPQHNLPRGSVTEAMVHQTALEKNIEIQIVKLPPGGDGGN